MKLNCSVAGGEESVRTRTCLYDEAAKKYQLIGDSLECGGKCRYPRNHHCLTGTFSHTFTNKTLFVFRYTETLCIIMSVCEKVNLIM